MKVLKLLQILLFDTISYLTINLFFVGFTILISKNAKNAGGGDGNIFIIPFFLCIVQFFFCIVSQFLNYHFFHKKEKWVYTKTIVFFLSNVSFIIMLFTLLINEIEAYVILVIPFFILCIWQYKKLLIKYFVTYTNK